MLGILLFEGSFGLPALGRVSSVVAALYVEILQAMPVTALCKTGVKYYFQ